MRTPTLTTLVATVLALALHMPAHAAELRVLSAGAIEPGLRPVLAAFVSASGNTIQLGFATAPQIRERAKPGSGEFDVVIAPPGVLDELETASRIDPDRTQRVGVGRVGIGVAVRPGVAAPDISTVDAFRNALVDAHSLVFNRASTGLYVETLLRRLNVDARGRITRYPDGASVMTHVLRGEGREIGLGAITEILLVRDQGLQFVGPLPAELQNYTSYVAAAAPARPAEITEAARALLRHLASAPSQAAFQAAGIEPLR